MQHYEIGDRIEGIYSHKGKLGTVLEESPSYNFFVAVKWDNAKRKSYVEKAKTVLLKHGLR